MEEEDNAETETNNEEDTHVNTSEEQASQAGSTLQPCNTQDRVIKQPARFKDFVKS